MTSFVLCITCPFLLSSKNISNWPPDLSSSAFRLVTFPSCSVRGSGPLFGWSRSRCSRDVRWESEVVSSHLHPSPSISLSWFSDCFITVHNEFESWFWGNDSFQKSSTWKLGCHFVRFKRESQDHPPPTHPCWGCFLLGKWPALWDTIHILLACSWEGTSERHTARVPCRGSGVLFCWALARKLKSAGIFCGFTWGHSSKKPHIYNPPNLSSLSSLHSS